MFFQLGLIILGASAINCALVKQRNTSIEVNNGDKRLNASMGDACKICKCTKDSTFGGIEMMCDSEPIPKNIPEQTTTLYILNDYIPEPKQSDFGSLPKLKKLVFCQSGVETLPSNFFALMTQLTYLDLRNNQLSHLPSNLFDPLTQLKHLFLHTENTHSFPPNLLNSLTQLEELELIQNYVTSIPPHFFDYNTQLTSLQISDNDLTEQGLATLPPNLFDHMPKLSYLVLNSNKLSSIPPNLFDHLPELGYLYLNDNNLSSLPLNLFKNQKKDRIFIDLGENPLICSCDLYMTLVEYSEKSDQKSDFGTCDGNINLWTMKYNNKDKFCGRKTTPKPTTPTTTPAPTKALTTTRSKDACHICSCRQDPHYVGGTYVDCHRRALTTIPINIPETTTTLNMFGNNLKTISFNDFKKLQKLTYLNLSHNKLAIIPEGAFDNLALLERLRISNNPLTRIEATSFDALEELKQIELRGNKLQSLPMYLFETMVYLERIDLRSNPLQCNCGLYHVLVEKVDKLKDKVLGNCDDDVELSTITSDNKKKFCHKRKYTKIAKNTNKSFR